MISFIKLKSETGHVISFGLKMKHFLVINTNFNPIKINHFADDYIIKVPEVSHLVRLGVYPDGTGYLIFRLKKPFKHADLMAGIINEFQNCFYNDKQKN